MKKFFGRIKERLSIKCFASFRVRKDNHPKTHKFLKCTFCLLLPMLCAVGGSVLGILEYNKTKLNPSGTEVILTGDKVNRRIYLISKDDLTIPLTVALDKKNTIQESVYDVFNLLKTSSTLSNEYVKGFINDKTKLNSFAINDKVLTLDMSEDFYSYGTANEIKILEALTMSFTQFDEIDALELEVDGKKVSYLPTGKTGVPSLLSKSFGINSIYQSTIDIIGKKKETVFFKKVFSSDVSYLVPVSFYVEKGESQNVTFVNAINTSIPVSYQLKKVEVYSYISVSQKVNDESFTLSIEKEGLVDDTTVKKELYELVSLSLDLMEMNQPVSFELEGEILSVDGIYSEEDAKVSSIIYNSTKI